MNPQDKVQTRESDIDLREIHDKHGNKKSEINIYEHQLTKPSENLNVINTMQYEQRVDLHINTHDYNSNNVDAVSAIVKRLRKPNSDKTKLGGDQLEFRKFVRQFIAKFAMNSDSEDEKMNYLEQFTYEEAHIIVQVFGHLSGEYAYNVAMKQLEDGYGDTEVIANTFKKKANAKTWRFQGTRRVLFVSNRL